MEVTSVFSKHFKRFFRRPLETARAIFPGWKTVLFFIFLILPLAVSLGGDKAKLTVTNGTDHYLHVIADGESSLYVSPGRGTTFQSDGPTDFVVNVFYSPGQGISGHATRTIRVVPFQPASSGCGLSGSRGFHCSTEPASGGSVVWEITPDSLQALAEQ